MLSIILLKDSIHGRSKGTFQTNFSFAYLKKVSKRNKKGLGILNINLNLGKIEKISSDSIFFFRFMELDEKSKIIKFFVWDCFVSLNFENETASFGKFKIQMLL